MMTANNPNPILRDYSNGVEGVYNGSRFIVWHKVNPKDSKALQISEREGVWPMVKQDLLNVFGSGMLYIGRRIELGSGTMWSIQWVIEDVSLTPNFSGGVTIGIKVMQVRYEDRVTMIKENE